MRRALALAALGLWVLAPAPADAQSRGRPAEPAKSEAVKPAAAPKVAAAPATPPAARPRGADPSQPVRVDADQLESIQKQGLVIFSGNVVARHNNSTQYADRMEVYLDAGGDKVLRTVSTGSVKIITRDCRTGTARRAEYYDAEQRVVLVGDARVWQDENVVTGERITIYLAEDRQVVEAGKDERVKAVFYPRREGEATAVPKPAPGTACKQP
ncbi:MAG TPA: lipopolysaccharide transport periplasmic protein LptA [Methylomirabilota bacterium]|nr:lipopolysaccharide transport periplasmic protein LptA [Methylomirabilota bacterium]